MGLNKEMTERIKSMLARDKTGIKEGFASALNGDLNKLLSDYFELSGRAEIKVEATEDGDYKLSFSARATRIKSFDSTCDAHGIRLRN